MRILALETANEQCSVAMIEDSQILFFQCDERAKMQTQVILPMIEQTLAECQCTWQDISAIAFSRGPGSFSGVRINATVTQALAWVHDLPVISISTLQALAYRAYRTLGEQNITAVLDARMNEVYLANYQFNEHGQYQADEERLLNYQQAQDYAQFLCVGSGASLITEHGQHNIFATAEDIAYLAERVPSSEWLNAEQALPIYLRNDAWKKIGEQVKGHVPA